MVERNSKVVRRLIAVGLVAIIDSVCVQSIGHGQMIFDYQTPVYSDPYAREVYPPTWPSSPTVPYYAPNVPYAPYSMRRYPQQQYLPPRLALPTYRTISQSVTPNPPLAPANLTLKNTHTDTLVVLLTDRRNSRATQKFRIPSGGSEVVMIDRDSGGVSIETREVLTLNGFWDRREVRTIVPAASLYDVSVYEEFLQSIAIDRTGTSPNPIEDINYQPRSIGLFIIPAGKQIAEAGTLDVFRSAAAARNPGAVRPLNQEDYEKPTTTTPDPLKKILNEFDGERASF